ncbi:McrB family protein [Peptoniphilus stercorisuis]|uniref:5-methylcytosine-specific restriction endonuclease McrBC GTP-binding regulatory subunit McrB n=1 Tax=Peptoniphilus stercorisuis TaxID=1436965 RepID=A0ABS4KFE0_9FIRM|nr:AAA family ATPase [Peptoniphilus stercorisuis]MBP2026100.1 5-methylcytosine-specific restriction endonuclease McrBC GTP-binding regulatory subunit McrB [Peptoniphilus stercorisuis]
MDKKSNYYLVGSMMNNVDYTEKFIEEGEWELGYFGEEDNEQYKRMLNIYNQIKPGDIMVIKSSYTRKNNLPFPNPTNQYVSTMNLKAKGIVKENLKDGHTILVDWDKDFKQREWYFFTSRDTMWNLSDSKYQSAKKLIDFIDFDKEQDYKWFLNQPAWGKYLGYNISKEKLKEILEFFVLVGQEKILTRVNDEITTANNTYYHENRVHMPNNTLGIYTNKNAWKENINYYKNDGVKEEWFKEGLECIHFANGNAQNKNYAWRNASIHFSTDHKYALEFMYDLEKANEDNIIKALDARFYKLYDENNKHNTNENSYISSEEDKVLFKIPVDVIQEENGKVKSVKVEISDENFKNFNCKLQTISKYFKEDKNSVKYLNEYSEKLIESKNIIFRGAPGTGKSYLAKEVAADIVSNGNTKKYTELTKEEKEQIEFVQFHPNYDYSDFVEGLRPKINIDGTMGFELQDGIFKKFAKKAKINLKNSKKNIKEIKKENYAIDLMENFTSNVNFELDEFKTLQGNKFYISSIDDEFINIFIPDNKISNNLKIKKDDLIKMLESKEEFEKVKDITEFFEKKNATQEYSYYLALFREIKKEEESVEESEIEIEKEKNYVFIIDEINRGEISKIFGELFFAIDPDYRGILGEISTQYSNMHEELDEKFYIPENVYIIGTMNDIDRSVDSFDFAMRRRFRFIEIKPEENIEMLEVLEGNLKDEAIRRMNALNKEIKNTEDLNENYQIGPSYFLKLKSIDFDKLWTDYLKPLLEDYINGIYDEKSTMEKFAKAYGYKEVGADNGIENQG